MSSYPPTRSIDLEALGPTLIQAACTILAIRTARREAIMHKHAKDVDLSQEVEFAVHLASCVIAQATKQHRSLFKHTVTPFTTGVVDEDVQL